MLHRHLAGKVLFGILGILGCAGSALAGGNVMPASANPKGYSLQQTASITAVYNTWFQAGFPAPAVPTPSVPFQILIQDVTVKPGTMLYLPIFVIDDSGGAPAGFPADVTNQKAAAQFMDGYVMNGFGVSAFIVQVDGNTTVLDDSYISGVKTAPLRDGTPAGSNYIVSAAFINPLTPGTHTVSFGGLIGGQPIAFVSINVTVK